MSSFRTWLYNGTVASARVEAYYDRANEETEAVSQEAKALRNDCARLSNNPAAFDELLRDMMRRNAVNLGHHR